MSASRPLFCVTCSSVCVGTLKRNSRAPASLAVNRTLTVADSPSGGSVTSCVLTMRPSSSMVSGTDLAAVAGLRQHDVDDERGALEDGARRLDACHLHVAGEAFLADADGEDRNRSRLERGERLVDRGVGGVRAVGQHHQAGQRQARELVARAVERRRQACGGAAELQLAGRGDAFGRRREAEEADDEFLRQRGQQGRGRAVQLLLHERAARLAVAIGDRHAARVVDEDAEEILLRHRGLEDQRRPEQADQEDADHSQPQRDEHRAIDPLVGRRHAAVGQQREDGDRGRDHDRQQHGPGQTPGEIALLKQQRRILEQKAEEVFQHLALILPGPALLSRTHRSFFPGAAGEDWRWTFQFRRGLPAVGRLCWSRQECTVVVGSG